MAKAKKTVEAVEGAEVEQTSIAQAEKKEKVAVVKDEQNGVVRPSSGATRRVWEIADDISTKEKRPANRAEVTEIAEAEGLVKGTIHTQFGRWRKYYGLTTPAEERAAKAAEAKAAKAAAKPAKAAKKAVAEPVAAEEVDEGEVDITNADEEYQSDEE